MQVFGAPERMLEPVLAQARRSGPSSLAWLSIVRELAPELSAGAVAASLEALGARGPDAGQVDEAARWLAASLAPRAHPARPAGLVRDWVVVGPFEDRGGGLSVREGPEDPASDPTTGWDRGAVLVRLRTVPPPSVTARGVPLGLLIHPRHETCSYLSSTLSLAQPQYLVVHVAASGAVRATWNGQQAFEQPELHEGAVFDRASFQVEASRGAHVLLLKVCSGPIADSGLVRVRVTDNAGRAVDLPWKAGLGTASGLAAARVRDRTTLLSRLLEVGSHPARSRALEAALARRFGGAEDLRTPRVPGLLDAVVRDARASVVELALAAWATPFGGERSGRLHVVLARARAEGDTGAQSFVLRRLAEQRLDSGFGDWAAAALGTEPVDEEQDTEARLLRARAVTLSMATRASAVREIAAVASVAGDVPAAWEALADASRTVDRGVWAGAQERWWAISPDADCSDYVKALSLRDLPGAAAAALVCGQTTPLQADEVVAVGRAMTDAGRYVDALRIFEAASSWMPNVAAYWTAASEAYAASGNGAPWMEQRATAAMRRAASLEPTDTHISSRLVLAQGQGMHRADERDLVDESVFLARKRAAPAQAGVQSERLLHWFRKVEVLDDQRVAQTLHYAREIVVAPHTPHELEEDLPIDDAGLEILRARVHRAEGGLAFAEEQESDGERSRVRWPQLHTGDVVEVALRTITSGPVGRRGDPPFYFVDYLGGSETAPMLHGEVVIDSPASRPLAVDILHGLPDRREDRVVRGRRLQRFTWDHPKNVADEPLSPEPTELLPTVVGSTFATWKDFLDWYRGAVQGFTEPDEQIRSLAAELTAGQRTREQKLRKIFEFVADEIRYVNYVSAEAWLPNRPQQVLARRQGDCDDKAILLIALLKAVGIDAMEVLLQSRYTAEPSVLLSEKAAVPLFDHGIAYVPGAAGAAGTWLDATNAQSRLGPVPSLDVRGLAVFVQHGEGRPIPSPWGAPAEQGVDSVWDVKLDEDGGGQLRATEAHAGDSGQELRGALAEADTRPAWIEKKLLAGWLGAVKVHQPVEFTPDAGEGVARVRYSASSWGVARREGRELVVQLAPGMTWTGTLAPLSRRTLPVVLPADVAPGHEVRTIDLTAPPGYEVGELAPGGEENAGEFGRASLSIERVGSSRGEVRITRKLVIDQSVIPVERYGAWRAWLQRVDALMQRSVRFVPRTSPEK